MSKLTIIKLNAVIVEDERIHVMGIFEKFELPLIPSKSFVFI